MFNQIFYEFSLRGLPTWFIDSPKRFICWSGSFECLFESIHCLYQWRFKVLPFLEGSVSEEIDNFNITLLCVGSLQGLLLSNREGYDGGRQYEDRASPTWLNPRLMRIWLRYFSLAAQKSQDISTRYQYLLYSARDSNWQSMI